MKPMDNLPKPKSLIQIKLQIKNDNTEKEREKKLTYSVN